MKLRNERGSFHLYLERFSACRPSQDDQKIVTQLASTLR